MCSLSIAKETNEERKEEQSCVCVRVCVNVSGIAEPDSYSAIGGRRSENELFRGRCNACHDTGVCLFDACAEIAARS